MTIAALGLTVCRRAVRYPVILDRITDSGEYGTANAVIVFDSTQIDLATDGTATTRVRRLVKVANALGRNNFGTVAVRYVLPYDTVVVGPCRTIRPDRRVIAVPESSITDLPMPVGPGSKSYVPNIRVVTITFPELADGGAVDYSVKTITRHPAFDSTFDYCELFSAFEPIAHKVVTINLPQSLNERFKWSTSGGGLEHSEKRRGGRTLHTWQADGVERIAAEPLMPSLENVGVKLLASCAGSWTEYSRRYWQISEPVLLTDPGINAKVSELVAGAPTYADTVAALYRFVAGEIRYVETELVGKRGGYEPAPVTVTFRNRYGVCRDKAALLVAMLRQAGIRTACLALTNPRLLAVDERVPVIAQFDHTIVAVEDGGGFFYLDPTVENSVDFLATFEDGKPVLVCTETGRPLAFTPVRPAGHNRTSITSRGVLAGDGSLALAITLMARGVVDMQIRTMCKMLPPEKIEQAFQSSLRTANAGVVMDSLRISDPDDFRTAMTIGMFCRLAGYAVRTDGEWRMTPGRSGTAVSGSTRIWNQNERSFPLYLGTSMETQVADTLFVPGRWKVKSLPGSFQYDDAAFAVDYRYRFDAGTGTVIGETRIVFKTAYFPPDAYFRVQHALQQLEAKQNESVILVAK